MPPDSKEIPSVPTAVIKAARQAKLVIFVGAGVSRLAGSPSWNEFADRLMKELVRKELLSFAELNQLNALHPRTKLSIAIDLCQANDIRPDFREILMKKVSQETNTEIFSRIYSLGVPLVTTNYDDWLDQLAEKDRPNNALIEVASGPESEIADPGPRMKGRVFYRKDDFTVEKLDTSGSVLHLHGSLREPESMVLTTRQYLEHYLDGKVMTFLERLFEKYIVLFIGYGLEEAELLEHIIRKGKSTSMPSINHYWLFPGFSHQGEFFRHLERYYRVNCNVALVNYCIDKRGYGQLETVVNFWVDQLKSEVRKPGFLQKIKLFAEVLDDKP